MAYTVEAMNPQDSARYLHIFEMPYWNPDGNPDFAAAPETVDIKQRHAYQPGYDERYSNPRPEWVFHQTAHLQAGDRFDPREYKLGSLARSIVEFVGVGQIVGLQLPEGIVGRVQNPYGVTYVRSLDAERELFTAYTAQMMVHGVIDTKRHPEHFASLWDVRSKEIRPGHSMTMENGQGFVRALPMRGSYAEPAKSSMGQLGGPNLEGWDLGQVYSNQAVPTDRIVHEMGRVTETRVLYPGTL